MFRYVLPMLLIAPSAATLLNTDNYEELTGGKQVLIKFFAPWCGHCKKLAPAWGELMDHYEGSDTVLVAKVDCTADGKDLCQENGIKGYPSIRYGDPSMLEEYKGGRTLDALKKFAEESLKPTCSPLNLDLCDDEKKSEIEKFMAMPLEDLEKLIEDKNGAIKELEENFQEAGNALRKQYEALAKEKDEKVEEIKSSGLSMMKAVKVAASKTSKSHEEL